MIDRRAARADAYSNSLARPSSHRQIDADAPSAPRVEGAVDDRSSLRLDASRVVRFGLACAIGLAAFGVDWAAYADNAIQTENAKPVDPTKDDWQPAYDASYNALNIGVDGTIDGYPSSWSVKNGDTLGLRVSTTAGSFRTIVTICCSFCCIAWNDVLWSACMLPTRRPVSSSGKRPLGTSIYSQIFNPIVTTHISMIKTPWRNDQSNVWR